LTVWLEINGTLRRVELPAEAATGGVLACAVDGEAMTVDAQFPERGVLSLIVQGCQYRCVLDGDAVIIEGQRHAFSLEDPRSLQGRRCAGDGGAGPRTVKAPMPGRVVRVLVDVGDEVAENQGVVVIEAMKMQNELKSPKAGRVVKIAVTVDDTVGSGDALVIIE